MPSPSLQRLTSLQTLDLSCSNLGDGGVTAIVSALAALRHLETLYLDGNEFGGRDTSAVQPRGPGKAHPCESRSCGTGNLIRRVCAPWQHSSGQPACRGISASGIFF